MNILQRSFGVALICAALLPAGSVRATNPTEVIFDSLPSPLPPNIPSLGFQATQTAELGDHVAFAGTSRKVTKVTVTMSAWGKQSEYSGIDDYANLNGWIHPITLNIYQVDPATPTIPGVLIKSVRQEFRIPWRPEPVLECGTAWKADDGNCYNGYAFNITFDLTNLSLVLPDEIIYGIAYNTQTFGANPIGINGPYNSLNVGLNTGVAPTVGTDVNSVGVFWNTRTAGWYADGGESGVGTFREDTNPDPENGWVGYVPAVRFEADVITPCTMICYVDAATGSDTNGGDTPATAKKTIQAAVNQVSAGGEVIVAAGSYAENVTIAKAVTLKGAQFGTAVGSRSFNGVAESTLTGAITVNAADVTIDGFSLTNPNQQNGIVVKTAGSNAQITYNFVHNVGATTLTAFGGAQAIYLENGPDGVSIVGNDIKDIAAQAYSSKGILIGDSAATDGSDNVLINDNIIKNISSVSRGAYGVIANNKIGATNLIVRNNAIDVLSGNWAHGIGLEGPTPSAIVEKNQISNLVDINQSTYEDSIAVFFESNLPYATSTVNRNSFTSATYGIAVHPALPAGSLNGMCNWWGNASGPSGVGAGTGVAVGLNVTFSPWLVTADLDGDCPLTIKGFYQPVDMGGVFNKVKAGSTVPLKFEIFAGTTELMDTNWIDKISLVATACPSEALLVALDEVTVTDPSTLPRYDTATGQFIFNWKTTKNMTGCYKLTLSTKDGSSLDAFFSLK